jgi:DNA polymerase elongation subunit (family B)
MKGILIDADYQTIEKGDVDVAIARVFFKTKDSTIEAYDKNFFYYFYVEAEKPQIESFGKFIKVEEVEKYFLGEKKKLCKVFVTHP